MTTRKITVSGKVVENVCLRELFLRTDEGSAIYSKISETKPTRKDSRITLEATSAEIAELIQESKFSGDYLEADDFGAVSAWAALGRQLAKVVA